MRLSALPRFRRHRAILTVYALFSHCAASTFANYVALEKPGILRNTATSPGYDSDFDFKWKTRMAKRCSPGNNGFDSNVF